MLRISSGASGSWPRGRPEDRQLEIKLIAELERRTQDVEARIAARRPYTPQESLDFLFFVSGAKPR